MTGEEAPSTDVLVARARLDFEERQRFAHGRLDSGGDLQRGLFALVNL
jgi:hypothetical protein